MIKQHPVLAYFGLAVLISWAGWIPYAAAQAGLFKRLVPAEVIWLAEFGPSLAAVLVAGVIGGPRAVSGILRKLWHGRIAPSWFLFVLGLTPVLVLLSLGTDHLLFGTHYDWGQLAGWDQRFVERTRAFQPSIGIISGLVQFMSGNQWATALGLVVLAITNGGLSEEIGWRGFALPALRQRGQGVLKASFLVGIMWGLWHTGTLFWKMVLTAPLAEGLRFAVIYLCQYLLLVVPLSLVYTAVMEGSRGSLLLAVLFHAAYNATITIAAAAWPEFPMLTMVVWWWILGLGLTAWFGFRRSAPVVD